MQANASVISTESTSRSQYKTSVYEESSIKLMKNTAILLSSKRNQVFSPLGSHVRTAASHVTCRKHNLHGVYSAFDTLFPSLLFTLANSINKNLAESIALANNNNNWHSVAVLRIMYIIIKKLFRG